MKYLIISIVLATLTFHLSSNEIFHFKDKSLTLTHSDVYSLESKEFTKLKDNRITYPIGDYYHWFKFTIKGNGGNKIIHIDEPYLDIVNLFYKDGEKWVEEKNGIIISIKDKTNPHRLPVFKQKIENGESKDFLLKIYTKRTMLNTGIHIEDERLFNKEEKVLQSLYLIFIGCMLSIIIYNLFILIRLKEKIYLYYILFGFFQLIWIILYSGFDAYVFPTYKINHFLSIAITLSSICLVIFFNKLLSLKKSLPKIYKFNRWMIGFMSLIAILTIINVRFYILVIYAGIPIPVYLIYISIAAYRKKLNQSSYLLFGMSWYIIGLIVIAGVNLGIIPYHNFTRYLFIAGSFIEFITYSMALVSRLDNLQKSLLKKEEDNRDKLEKLVKERTRELSLANKELEKLAISDSLTGLYNRRYFEARFESEWSRLSRIQNFLGCIMIDVDHFKKYNDSFGHMEGDEVLVKVANTIKMVFARSSDICSRFGGEEFIVLLPDTDINKLYKLGEKLVAAVRSLQIPHITDDKIVTVSVGVSSIIPSSIRKKEILIDNADKALYLSKDGGRNQVNKAFELSSQSSL